MDTIRADFSISASLFEQVERLAHERHVSLDQIWEQALEDFVRSQRELASSGEDETATVAKREDARRLINQGDIFWIEAVQNGTELGNHRHPYVVIQDDLLNHSRIDSVVVCALTTNLRQATAPVTVLLEVGEANLPKQSAVVVSKVSAVSKSQLGDYIGSLDKARVEQILAGMRFLQSSFFAR